jgi:hypothetical protein
MFTGITANFNLTFLGSEPLLLGSQNLIATPRISDAYALVNGLVATSDAIDGHFEDYGPAGTGRVLAASATKTYTLSALVDTIPRTTALVDVKYMLVMILLRAPGDYLTVAPGGTHGWTQWIPSGSCKIYRWAGFVDDKTDSRPVVASTTDQITITNGGSGPITYVFATGGNTG